MKYYYARGGGKFTGQVLLALYAHQMGAKVQIHIHKGIAETIRFIRAVKRHIKLNEGENDGR